MRGWRAAIVVVLAASCAVAGGVATVDLPRAAAATPTSPWDPTFGTGKPHQVWSCR